MTSLSSIFTQWNTSKVLILGDCMIDAYFYGTHTRNSPEAPVPIINLEKKEKRLGGAANVALNIKALGATPILCSIVGDDWDGQQLLSLLNKESLSSHGVIIDKTRNTTVKTRVIGNNKHFLRIDEESTTFISKEIETEIITKASSLLADIDVLIFQDYNKGLLTPHVIKHITKLCNELSIPIVVDPKYDQFFEFKNCTLFKPNRKEIAEAYHKKETESLDFMSLTEELRNTLNAQKVMTTLSENGVLILDANTKHHFQAHPRKIVDVSGAGDSVLSVAALCVASGLSNTLIAHLSNLAGGLVCEKVGVVPVDKAMLLEEASQLGFDSLLL